MNSLIRIQLLQVCAASEDTSTEGFICAREGSKNGEEYKELLVSVWLVYGVSFLFS